MLRMSFNKKVIFIVFALFCLSAILFSPLAQVGIQQNTVFDKVEYDPDVVVLQVGTDYNVQLAVDTFLKHYPDAARVDLITSWQELQEGILSFPNADHVIFGHGTEEGLSIGYIVLKWDILKEFINTNQDNDILVMACYSGDIDGNFIGVYHRKIDAEAAGLMSYIAYFHDSDEINPNLFDLMYFKQMIMDNPLSFGGGDITYYKKEYGSSIAAAVGVMLDRSIALGTQFAGKLTKILWNNWVKLIPAKFRNVNLRTAWPTIYLIRPGLFYWGYYLFCEDYYSISAAIDHSSENIFFAALTSFIVSGTVAGAFDRIICIQYIDESGSKQNLDAAYQALIAFSILTQKNIEEILRDTWVVIVTSALYLKELIETPSKDHAEVCAAGITLLLERIMAEYLSEIAEIYGLLGLGLIGVAAIGIAPYVGGIITSIELSLPVSVKAGIATTILAALLVTDKAEQVSADVTGDDVADNDSDGILNYEEKVIGTCPNSNDTDSDTFDDFEEILMGYNPLNPASPGIPKYRTTEFASSDNIIEVSREIDCVDRIKAYYKGVSGAPYDWVSAGDGIYNVSGQSVWEEEFDEVIDTTPIDVELTDFKFEYYRQNDTAGTEWVKLYTTYLYAIDNDDLPQMIATTTDYQTFMRQE